MSQCRLEWDCKCQDVANNTYYCVRKLDQRDNSIFCQFDDEEQFVEAYDLNEDPYQLTNIYLRNSKANRNQQKEIIESLKKVKSFIFILLLVRVNYLHTLQFPVDELADRPA